MMDKESHSLAPGSSLSSSPPARTILVVDDEAGNRALFEALLSSQDYQVVLAEGGEQALRALETSDIDLMLLDLMMPRMDGVEVCQALRGDARYRSLPIVVVTALSDRESRIRAKEAGADDFLEKPIDALELLIRVENLLKLRTYQEQLEEQAEALEDALRTANTGLIRAERQRPGGLIAAALSFEMAALAAALRDADSAAAREAVVSELKHHAAALETFARRGTKLSEALDVRDVLSTVVARLSCPGTLRDDICLHVPNGGGARLCMNRALLEQMLESLLLNALDSFDGVHGRRRQVRVQYVSATAEAPVRIIVEDNGAGIEEAALARVCEPYFRRRSQGAGLGLSLVQKAAASLGGNLSLQSRLGAGTTATIVLPASIQEGPP